MDGDDPGSQARKRRRVSVACDQCRRRKIRCDGRQPVCTFCADRAFSCVYHRGPQRVQVSRDYLDSLVRQVRELRGSDLPPASDAQAGRSTGRPRRAGTGHEQYGYGEDAAAAAAAAAAVGATPTCSDLSPASLAPAEDPREPPLSLLTPDTTRETTALRRQAAATAANVGVDDGATDSEEEARSVTDTIICAGSPPPATRGSFFGSSSTPAFLEVVQNIASRDDVERARELRRGGRRHGGGDHHPPPGRYPLPPPHRPSFSGGSAAYHPHHRRDAHLHIRSRFLPPRSTSDHLLELYFSHVCVTYTVLHEPTFREQYERLWQPGTSPPQQHQQQEQQQQQQQQPDSLWFCIANAMFAVAALFSHRLTAPESEATAETFFAQAQELCDLDTLAYDSLATVQALLLMGHYLHIRRVTRCWYVFGLAIRIAQGLGLHSPDVNRRYGAVERETRKRCWCACLVMDSMLGMTFGRPMMIPAECYQNADLPAPVDDVLDGPAPAPTAHETHPPSSTGLPTSTTGAGKTPKILVFLCRVKLCVVLQGILRSLYQQQLGDPVGGAVVDDSLRVGDMARLDQQLSDWLTRLPPSFQLHDDETPDDTPSMTNPSYMLYSRYLTVRILLLRPSLTAVARAGATGTSSSSSSNTASASATSRAMGGLVPLPSTFWAGAAQACIETARRLVAHVRAGAGRREREVLGAAWYSTNCVFNAALVLFAAQAVPALRALSGGSCSGSQGGDGVRRCWLDCADLMRSLAPSCRSARACLEMMEALDRHLAQQRQQQQQQQEHVQPYQQQTTSVGGNPEQQERGLETGRWSMPDFRSISPSVVLPDWAESFGLDELLLGRDFGFLQEGSQGL